MPSDNDILADLARFANHALDVDGRTFDLFVSKAQAKGVALADMVHAVNDVHARYVAKGKDFEPLACLLYSCNPANRDRLPPKALTFRAWREQESAKANAGASAEARARDEANNRAWAQKFCARGESECKRICAEFMLLAREFQRVRGLNIGGQMELELSARTFENVCKRIEQGHGTAIVQDAAYMECWARGTWQFPKLDADTDTSRPAPVSPQMVTHERMERRLEERDGPLADAFCKREDRMTRVLAALNDPKGPCVHLQKQLGEWAAQGDLNWRAATMKLGKDEVTLRPTARAFLAVLEHEARGTWRFPQLEVPNESETEFAGQDRRLA